MPAADPFDSVRFDSQFRFDSILISIFGGPGFDFCPGFGVVIRLKHLGAPNPGIEKNRTEQKIEIHFDSRFSFRFLKSVRFGSIRFSIFFDSRPDRNGSLVTFCHQNGAVSSGIPTRFQPFWGRRKAETEGFPTRPVSLKSAQYTVTHTYKTVMREIFNRLIFGADVASWCVFRTIIMTTETRFLAFL